MGDQKEKEFQNTGSEEFEILNRKIEKLQNAGMFAGIVTGIILLSIITGLVKVGNIGNN